VDPPNLPRGPPASALNVFMLSHFRAGLPPKFLGLLDHIGWNTTASLEHELLVETGPGGSLHATAEARDDAPILHLEADAAAPYPAAVTVRLWQLVPGGTATWEADVDVTAAVGVGTCTAREGTIFAEAIGGTECLPSDVIAGAIVGAEYPIRVSYYSGVRPQE
jgi:hypothetical protein